MNYINSSKEIKKNKFENRNKFENGTEIYDLKNHSVTQTLAEIYKNQGYYDKAIIAYEILSLKYPQKSSLFANEIKLIKNFNPTDKNFNFFKNYLYISTSFELDTDMSDLLYFINNSDHQTDWINLELSFLVAMEMYFLNDNSGALDFINECCMSILENSDDAIHLFKYGILLERNNEIKKAEEIIQKSIDISKSSYPYILNYLAYLWVENDRKLDLAESMLQKAVKDSNYNDGAILDSLGWLYFKKDNLDLAEKWIYDAYQLEPSEPEIIDHLSQIYYELGRYKESKFLDNKIILFHKDYFKYEEVLGRNENK